MNAATLTSQYQVTVPSYVRNKLGLKPGDKVIFSKLSDSDSTLVMTKLQTLKLLRGGLASYKKNYRNIPRDELWLENE